MNNKMIVGIAIAVFFLPLSAVIAGMDGAAVEENVTVIAGFRPGQSWFQGMPFVSDDIRYEYKTYPKN